MKINTFKHFAVDALKSIKRNRTISSAAAATVAATLFIFGVFLLLILNVNQAIKDVESQVQVTIFLKNDITSSAQNTLEDKIKNMDNVSDVQFKSKSDALNQLKDQLGEQNQNLIAGYDTHNPLPSSYVIKMKKPEMVAGFVESIKDEDGIDQIRDGQDIVNQIISITRTVKWIGIVIFSILIAVSLFLISNTIKLTVYSRRREIGIMKYIGATDWFIRWPFILEGIVIGVIGAIISIIVLFYAYNAAYAKISIDPMLIQLVSPYYILTNILWAFVLAGIVIGSLGSIMAIRKFLSA